MITITGLFKYFSEHSSYSTFDMVQFLELQGCETKFSSTFQSKKFIEGIKSMKGNSEKYKDVKAFASSIIDDNFFVSGYLLLCT